MTEFAKRGLIHASDFSTWRMCNSASVGPTENFSLIACLQMKLWLVKVGKLDACIRPLFANSVTYVTEYCKTDHVRTFGQLLFIGPANSHTHTLPVHCCINGLSWLVCFSRHGFADRVKSRLRQWDPWRALDGRYGYDIHPCVGETSLKALQLCLGLWLALLGLIATPNSPVGRCPPPPASHPPLHPPHPLHPPPTR